MCIKCTTKSNAYGEVVPGFELFFANLDVDEWKAGEWGLIQDGRLIATWQAFACEEPIDLINRRRSKSSNLNSYRETIFWETYREFAAQFVMTPEAGFQLVNSSLTLGYNHAVVGDLGFFSYWFFLRIAGLINKIGKIQY